MKMLTKVFYLVLIIMLAWITLSYMDIILHNLDPEPVYRGWNFFVKAF